MNFIVGDTIQEKVDTVYLINDKWDDWFTYETQYRMNYVDASGNSNWIGYVKIGKAGQTERRAILPEFFVELDDSLFSLGASEDYYLNLQKYLGESMEEVLIALHDVAYNLDLYEQFKFESVMQNSLMRDITKSTLVGQFYRMAHGGSRLTNYSFVYTTSTKFSRESTDLEFDVIADSKPPTNIHALIGKNGVGKTTLLRDMLRSVESKEYSDQWGGFDVKMRFSNVIFISYSAFDMPIMEDELNYERSIPYSYVGLIGKKDDGQKYIKNIDALASDFSESLYVVAKGRKKKLWNKVISILDSGKAFANNAIEEWADNALKLAKDSGKNRGKKEEYPVFHDDIAIKFNKLSSGHKVILLTLIKLVELVEEKTLVIMDEPEEHLHPPLVSAFIRALSYLLIYRNGVGIIATHSPVIVQEIPRKCVWKVRRVNEVLVSERPKVETFGENLGDITSEIFGYEVLESGFHKMLKDEAKKTHIYERALSNFGEELGNEARSILKAYIYERNNNED